MSKKKSIVIADDSMTFRFYCQELLREFDVDLFLFENGQEVVDHVKAHPTTDLVFLDINMPVLDGIRTLQALKAINADISVIAQSAFASEERVREYLHMGFDLFFSKPIDADALVGLVDQVCSASSKNDEGTVLSNRERPS